MKKNICILNVIPTVHLKYTVNANSTGESFTIFLMGIKIIVIIFPYSKWWKFLYSTKHCCMTLHLRCHTISSPTFTDTKT